MVSESYRMKHIKRDRLYKIYAQQLPCAMERKTHPVEKSEKNDAAPYIRSFSLK